MSEIALGNLTISRDRFEVFVSGKPVELTFVEFELLFALARHAGKVMSRQRLLQSVWGEDSLEDDSKLTVHMSRLRKKLEGSYPWQIQTYTKRGYALKSRQATARAPVPPSQNPWISKRTPGGIGPDQHAEGSHKPSRGSTFNAQLGNLL